MAAWYGGSTGSGYIVDDAPATTSGRVVLSSTAINNVFLYRNGNLTKSLFGGNRWNTGASGEVRIGPAKAFLCFALFYANPLNASQIYSLDLVVKDFLIERGRPICQ
jgi:hypothetical protein